MTDHALAALERRIGHLIDAAENAARHVRTTTPGSTTHRLAQASLARSLDRLRDARAEIMASSATDDMR